MTQLLIFTCSDDYTVSMVLKHLPNIDVTIIDPEQYPKLNFSMSIDNSTMSIFFEGKDITYPNVVWFRKPSLIRMEDIKVPLMYKEVCWESYSMLFKSMQTIFPSAFWISEYWNIMKVGNSKPYQLQLAVRIGFKIPRTLITSNSYEAEKFVLGTQANCITKPFTDATVIKDGLINSMFTTRIDKSNINFEGLNLTPMIFQEEISGVDIRVTVIGNEVFPCRIDKNTSAQEEVDWRRIQLDNVLTYSLDEEFPYSLAQLCREMIKILGLEFGAIDFMKQGDEYYFLEINPNGQWGFVELEAGIQISQSFAELIRSKIRD